jgi:hypothetical protein
MMLVGQSQPPAERYPDQGFLSESRYTNLYFGFSFDFPADAQLQPVHRPVAADGHLQLLELDSAAPQHLTIAITAFERRAKNDLGAKQMLRKELDNELFYGVEELHGLSKTSIAKHQFFLYETRRGIDEHFFLATDLDGYTLHVAIAGRDDRMINRLEAAFAAAKFFDPSEARQYAGPGAKPYEGPAMSSHKLASLASDPPASHIDSGKVVGGEYTNPALGLAYLLPAGWYLGTEPAVQREVERMHLIAGDGPALGRAEAELVRACNRVLFSAWKEKRGVDGKVGYEDFGEVTLSAMSLACFPDMRFPDNLADAARTRAFLSQFALTHPLLHDTRQGKAFESAGHIFILTEGTVAFQVDGDALSRRLSIAMLITQHRGYLLTWFFAAPHDSELRELMNTKMVLDTDPMLKQAGNREVSDGGGIPAAEGLPSVGSSGAASHGVSTGEPAVGSATSAPLQSASAPTLPSGSATPGNESSSPSPAPNAEPAAGGAQGAKPPSLLRPGESMKDQQMQGTPVPKKH